MRGFMGPLASDAQSYLSTLSAPILGRPHLPSPGPPLQLLDGTSPLCLHLYLSTNLPEAHLGSQPSHLRYLQWLPTAWEQSPRS